MDSSKKSGKQSTAKKFASSRHGFDPAPATSPVPGAFGKTGKPARPGEDAPRSRGGKRTPRTRSPQEGLDEP